MVVAFHAGLPVPGGFVGVDVFFVISGFVITSMLQREWASTGIIRFRQFYLKRFKRLIPALALMVAVVVIASALILSLGLSQIVAQTGIGAILLSANFVIALTTGEYFDPAAEMNPLLNTWSLSVEEQFYLIFPAFIAFGWYLARRAEILSKVPYILIGGITVVSFGFCLVGSSGWGDGRSAEMIFGFYSPFARVWEFAVGALLALALTKSTLLLSSRVLTVTGTVGMGMLAASLWLISETTIFPGPWTLLPVTGTLLLLLAGTRDNPVSSALGTRPLVQIGNWSYSIYLWHWPFIVFAVYLWPASPYVVLLAVALSFIPALASYHWVEEPIRTFPSLGPKRWTALIGATVALPIALGAGLWIAAQNSWWSAKVQEFQDSSIRDAASRAGCTGRLPLSQALDACTWNSDASGSPIYLLGDSNAYHFSETFITAAEQIDRPLVISAAAACPFVDIFFIDTRGHWDDARCRTYVQESIRFLENSEPGIVVISNSSIYWDSAEFEVGLSPEIMTAETSPKVVIFQTGIHRTIKALKEAGHQVVIVQTVPYWEGDAFWEPSRCSVLTIVSEGCVGQQLLVKAQEGQGVIREAIKRTSERTGATIWDPGIEICPEGICTTQSNGFVRYRDGSHISVAQAILLGPAVARLLTKIP